MSVDAVQPRLIWLLLTTVAVSPVGAVGAVVSRAIGRLLDVRGEAPKWDEQREVHAVRPLDASSKGGADDGDVLAGRDGKVPHP